MTPWVSFSAVVALDGHAKAFAFGRAIVSNDVPRSECVHVYWIGSVVRMRVRARVRISPGRVRACIIIEYG